ncbi:class I SAM-dependent methyltransferase [Micromonospora endolithica]|uniref:Methyltransferase domain-containing protein n=1 Tax=Micromonospora endolithica TaxID=230091 RepID=A0A3A9ZJP9_9ACTN|nr:methyltransferase domain-containing protein [Micromonospora endolithica]RKN47556.1 methyltransferase domain-containing protein [Micromonospora endolithica]TWJ21199.1 methyltransferase family protein [Micromonospora endolithica]
MTSSERSNGTVDVFEQAATSYDRTGVSFFGPFGAELVRRAGIRPGARVLDVGCGRGAVLFPAAEATGPTGRVTGTDLAPAMVALTAEDATRAGLTHVDIRMGDAQQPDFPAGSFDVVLAGLVVFLLPEPEQALRAYARLLRPAGRVAISTFGAMDPAFVAAMDALARHLPADQPRPAPTDDPFADDQTVTATMAAAGLTVTAISQHRVESRFRDVDHWMEWMWSHGARALLRHIPAELLDAATTDAARALAPARLPGGGLALITTIRVTVAVPSPAAACPNDPS